ncbi:MAG: glycosyltransferase [Acidimicrobiales bacterium]
MAIGSHPVRVLAACSLGGAGHLEPLLPFLDAAARRGDERLVVGPAALAETARATGHPFRAGGEPPEGAVAAIRERLPVAPAHEAAAIAARELFGRLATAAMMPAMEAAAGWRPDLVLREPCEYSSAVVAQRLRIPVAQVAISVAEGEDRCIRLAAPALEAFGPGTADALRAMPYLTRFPPSLDPSPFPSTTRYRVPARGPTAPLPDWWDGETGPLVYVTFGTVLGHMSAATGVFRAALAAMEGVPARVLLTVGRGFDPSHLGRVPPHVHVERWVHQDDALARADLVVCHGGSGTVYGALAAGVPLVVAPVFADQFENGRRVAGAGAALLVEAEAPGGPDRRVLGEREVPALAAAVTEALGRSDLRRRAGRLADEMAAAPPVGEAMEMLASGAGRGAGSVG